MCEYLSNKAIFADFFNGVLFEGHQEVKGENLELHDKEYFGRKKSQSYPCPIPAQGYPDVGQEWNWLCSNRLGASKSGSLWDACTLSGLRCQRVFQTDGRPAESQQNNGGGTGKLLG